MFTLLDGWQPRVGGPPGVSGKTLGDLPDALVRRNIEDDFRMPEAKVKRLVVRRTMSFNCY
jgi:hypothetical protein